MANDRPNKATHHLLSGATSGLASAVILQPLDLVKTRLQQGAGGGDGGGVGGKGKGKGRLGRVVKGIVKDEGVGALWRGTVPTVVR